MYVHVHVGGREPRVGNENENENENENDIAKICKDLQSPEDRVG